MGATDAPQRALGSTNASWATTYGYGAPTDPNEHIPDLIFPASIPVLARMRSDPTIASGLASYVTALVAADWHIDPAGATPEMTRICADSLGLPIAGESPDQIGAGRARGVKWREHLRLMSLHLVYGFMPFEPVYEIRDGKAYLKYLAERLPSTIVEVKVNPDGTLKSIVQEGAGKTGDPNGVEIPADRLIVYVHDREGAAWTGRPLIRPCYSAWLLKLDTLRVNAIGIARFGAGTPVMEQNPGTTATAAQIEEAKRAASAVRVGETGGMAPAGFTLRIKGVEGSLPDAIPTLRLYDEQISRSLLTSLLDLGNTSNGSRALGDNFADVMQRALQSIGNNAAETATQLCERLTTFNEGENAVSPVVRCGSVGASKAAISASVAGLVTAGLVTPDASLESFVRDGYHLPPKDAAPTPAEPAADPVAAEPSAVTTLAASGWDSNKGNIRPIMEWFERGEGAVKIRWGTSGDWERCKRLAEKHMTPEQASGFCAERHHAVTGEWPGPNAHGGKVHAAEGDPQPYREPTPQERAAGIDPAQVDEAQDGLVAEGMALFAAIVAVWGAAIAAQITASLAAGSLAGLARLRVDSTDAAQGLAVLMREAADAGIESALGEATRAGILKPTLKPAVDEPALDDAAAGIADLMGQGLASAAGREAARIAGPDSDPKTVARTAVATVTESDTPIHDAIQAGVTRAMGAGRAAAQAALMVGADLVPFHAGIRDRSQCSSCAEHDGTEYPSLAAALTDFPTGHYAACLGRSNCRCMVALRPAQ